MNKIGCRSLIVWQKADLLAKEIYKETKSFPQHEIFGMTSQLRRAALSVPTNIVEGYGRFGQKEFKRFLLIALGSLSETEYLLDFSFELNFFDSHRHQKLQSLRQEVGNLLWKFYIFQKK